MVEELRCLKIAELKRELEQLEMEYASMFDEVNAITGQLNVLRYARKDVENYRSTKHSFWERFTKRKEYLAYRANLATLQDGAKKEAELNNRLVVAEVKSEQMINDSHIKQKITDKKHEIAQAKKATSLAELGVTKLDAVKILESHGITPTWGNGDYQIYNQMHDSENKQEALVAQVIDHTPRVEHDQRVRKCTVERISIKENLGGRDNL
ncbi:MAG: hypothetical protein KIG16_03825 [Eubacteriales bacterium]|nr:hypothetical protein [Eubacteriales bacterium]